MKKFWKLSASVAMVWVAFAFVAIAARGEDKPPPKIAAIVTAYYHNSHADVIAGRLLDGYTLDGKGDFPRLKLVSLYTDQVPANDISREVAKKHGVPIFDKPADALTLGTGKLAVDGVLLICEHGEYPESPTGSIQYPKRRLFAEIVKVFEASGRVVPVFSDKHLSDNWEDAKWIYDSAQRLKIPMMAGSSLPVLWRYPPADVARGAKLKELVAISYHRLDTYGFHALEFAQALVERRFGGETGIKAVRCLGGDAVWQASERGDFDRRLLDEALSRIKDRPLPKDKRIEDLAKEPQLMLIEYNDGLRVAIVTLNYAVGEWTAAWRFGDDRTDSTLFWTQENRPFMHFTHLLRGVETMFHTGQPTWPVERTLLTSGVLDALLQSRKQNGARLETPQLGVTYQSTWNWQQPPPPPPDRPIQGK